jgi:hypothetical protein
MSGDGVGAGHFAYPGRGWDTDIDRWLSVVSERSRSQQSLVAPKDLFFRAAAWKKLRRLPARIPISDILKWPKESCYRDLDALVKSGILKQEGRGRGTFYTIAEKTA